MIWNKTAPQATLASAPSDATTGADDQRRRLAAILIERGQCDSKTLDRAWQVGAESQLPLEVILIKLGLVGERGLAEAFATLLAWPITGADRYPAEAVLPERLRAAFLRQAKILPLAVDGAMLRLAVANPFDQFTLDSVRAATGLSVAPEIAVPIELDAALDRLYHTAQTEHAADAALSSDDDTERLKDLASDAPVIRLVNHIIARAVETQASDIHIEPFEDRLRVRYRYDGVLHEADSPPTSLIPAIISRIKIMARLDIAERRLPQDGRIKLPVRGQDIDFRVSTIPSLYGENVVLRVLDRSNVTFDYEKLGLAPAVVAQLNKAFELPNGIVLVTGPTGSGKTTTLYTGLLGLNSVARKIVTVEDPIEYQLHGISQIQVKPQIDLTFAALLRSILRQDPDVIMVGEIRDLETAQIAVQAALTGHLVLSTLHTNSAAATVTRLRDMGLEDYLINAVLRGVLAQRLVRRLCMQCRQPIVPQPDVIRRFDLECRAGNLPVTLWRPVGCAHCRNTGYRGRQAIAEFLRPDETVEQLIFAKADHNRIEEAAVAAGMVSMFDTGISAALAGDTTIEEVVRSIRADS